ncbi:MAG: hypothetical protein AMXMBFR7_11140 [Planctomycetota bacterium]
MRTVERCPDLPDRLRVCHSLPFDPRFGYSLSELLAIEPPSEEPHDYARFWRQSYETARAAEGSLRIERREIQTALDDVTVFELDYLGHDGFKVGGWLCAPKGCEPRALMVTSHGYGGRETYDAAWARRGCAVLLPCARGFHRSAHDGVPHVAAFHVVHGIESKESYLLRACVMDLWLAGSVLRQLFPNRADRLIFTGGSFGGGLGALMLPWDTRYRAAYLSVPTFGNHPIRLRHPCTGSGESVRRLWLREPGIERTLRYYDAALAARRIAIPVATEAAMFDPAVIPPGQFSVANAIQCPGSVTLPTTHGHFDLTAGAPEAVVPPWVGRRVMAFLTRQIDRLNPVNA